MRAVRVVDGLLHSGLSSKRAVGAMYHLPFDFRTAQPWRP